MQEKQTGRQVKGGEKRASALITKVQNPSNKGGGNKKAGTGQGQTRKPGGSNKEHREHRGRMDENTCNVGGNNTGFDTTKLTGERGAGGETLGTGLIRLM